MPSGKPLLVGQQSTYLVKSNPWSSSSTAGLGGSSTAARLLARVGLGTGGDLLRAGGGLLLGGGSPPNALDGLRSKAA